MNVILYYSRGIFFRASRDYADVDMRKNDNIHRGKTARSKAYEGLLDLCPQQRMVKRSMVGRSVTYTNMGAFGADTDGRRLSAQAM